MSFDITFAGSLVFFLTCDLTVLLYLHVVAYSTCFLPLSPISEYNCMHCSILYYKLHITYQMIRQSNLLICLFYFETTGKLVLKIPWKNLYSEPVVAQVDGLYLLVRPNTGMFSAALL